MKKTFDRFLEEIVNYFRYFTNGKVGSDDISLKIIVNKGHDSSIIENYSTLSNDNRHYIPLYNLNNIHIPSYSISKIDMGIHCQLSSIVTRLVPDSWDKDFSYQFPYFGSGGVSINYEIDSSINIPIQLFQRLDIHNYCCYDENNSIEYDRHLYHDFSVHVQFFNPTDYAINIPKDTLMCYMYFNQLSSFYFESEG